jgi:hypothetical protein
VSLEIAYADGQLAALGRYKLGFKPIPTVANSAALTATKAPSGLSPSAVQNMQPPTTPQKLTEIFDAHEQGETRTDPRRKLSAENVCTTCRKPKHYGNCSRPRLIPEKAADFNLGMHGSDPVSCDGPSTSPGYHSAVSSISSLARAQEGRPADEQAASGFADLFRHQGIRNSADEPGRMYGGLNKTSASKGAALGLNAMSYFRQGLPKVTPAAPHSQGIAFLDKHQERLKGIPQNFKADAPVAREMPHPAAPRPVGGPSSKVVVDPSLYRTAARKLADFMLPGLYGSVEKRGPTVNPYAERPPGPVPVTGNNDTGTERMWRSFDNVGDSTCIDGNAGAPSGEPAA